jgi:uncharacterized membrane protein (UPF0127 family)
MMHQLTKLLYICLFATAIVSCKKDKKVIKPAEVAFNKEGELTLYKSISDSIITKLDLEIADTAYDVETGLMYRSSMKDTQGMLFVFPTMRQRSFYMKNTQIPLDLIFLDNNNFIVSFQENAKPLDESSLPSLVPAQYVLEINAGLAEKWLLEIGDRMEYTKL